MKFTVSKDKHLRTDLKISCRVSAEEIAQMLVVRLGTQFSFIKRENPDSPDLKKEFLNQFKKITQKKIQQECSEYVTDYGRWVPSERIEDLGSIGDTTYEDLIPEIITILKKRLKLTY